MAKKIKEEEIVESGEVAIEKEKKGKKLSVEANIIKQFGDNVLVDAQYIFNKKQVVIPIGPALDSITGGIPEGSWVVFTGQPKCGKSTTALFFAATAQDPKYGGECCPEGRHVYFYPVEGRLKERDLAGIPHLNRDRFHVIQSTPGNILCASDYLEIADQFINEKPGSVHIIDSYSALCTEAEKTGTMADMQRADGAKALAKFCRKTCNVVPVNNCIVIGITHQMGNPGMGHSPWKEKSGQAVAYQSDVKIQCLYHKPWKLKEDGPQIGQEVIWTCLNTARQIPPGQQCTSFIRYGMGIDVAKEVLDMAVDLGLIERGGAWYTFPMFDNAKAQGLEGACQLMRNTPNGVEIVYGKLREMLGM